MHVTDCDYCGEISCCEEHYGGTICDACKDSLDQSDCTELENAAMQCVYVKEGSRLAKAFNLKQDTSLARLNRRCDRREAKAKQRDPRSVSVKFDEHQNIKSGTSERQAVLAKYRAMAENNQPIEFDVNEHRLNNNEIAEAKNIADVKDIIDAHPEIIVFGRGQPGLMEPDDSLREFLHENNIKLIEESTSDAVQSFNRLRDEGRAVSAGFHLTC